jgi:hypothetical protein
MTDDFLGVMDLLHKVEIPDEDKHFIKSSLWREGATPKITSPGQYARYLRIAAELKGKYAAKVRSSVLFVRSPDGVFLTSLEARIAEWEIRASSRRAKTWRLPRSWKDRD